MTNVTPHRLLHVRRESFWLQATIDDEASRNALTGPLVEELLSLARAIADDRSLRALVITGSNGVFCAGADLKTLAAIASAGSDPGAHNPVWQANRRGGELFETLAALPQVVIAAINGPAMGGGLGLACCADIVICLERALFALSETRLGVVPAQIAPYVVERIGLRSARRLALTGDRLDGRAAVAIGLADQLASSDDQLQQAVAATLASVGRCAPEALAHTKKLLLSLGRQHLTGFIDSAADLFLARANSSEGREGLDAFIAKRAPSWTASA